MDLKFMEDPEAYWFQFQSCYDVREWGFVLKHDLQWACGPMLPIPEEGSL